MATVPGDTQQRLQSSPGNGNTRRDLIRLLSLLAGLLALLVSPAWPAKWDIVPTLSAGEVYTDNLSLTPDTLKQSAWVTQVIPGISIAGTGSGLRFNASYAPQLLYYSRNSQDDSNNKVYQQLKADGNVELASQLLYIDAGGGVGQEAISLQGPISTSNINTTGNLATVKTFFVSPYLLRAIGSAAQATARFTHSVRDSNVTSASGNSNSTANRVNLLLASGPVYKLLTWDVAYSNENIDYDNQPGTKSEVLLANARRLITPTVGVLAQVGYENYDYGVQSSEGLRWSTGLNWTPSARTNIAATVGERSFGHSYFLDFRHRSRLTAWSVGYSEDITSSRSEAFVPSTAGTAGYLDPLFLPGTPDPADRQKAVERFIAQTGLPQSLGDSISFSSNQPYLVKRWRASSSLLGVRNVLIANLYRETREVQGGTATQPNTGDFATSSNIRQSGTDLAWNLRLTPQDTWNLGASYSRIDYVDINQTDYFNTLRMGLTRQFQPRVSGSLSYRRQQKDSYLSTSSYTENAVSASVAMRF